MAWALEQCSSFVWAVSSESKVRSKQSVNRKREVKKMMCTLQAAPSMRSMCGLLGVNRSHELTAAVWRPKAMFEHAEVVRSTGINMKDEAEIITGRGIEIPFTPHAKRILELSLEEARELGNDYIGSEHLLLGLLREDGQCILESLGVDTNNLRKKVMRMVGESAQVVGGGSCGDKMPFLEKYGTDLTNLAKEGLLAPVFGAQPEIERVAQILGTKNNPCLIGECGVGKTSIVHGLAHRIANGDAPETIKGKKVIALDMHLSTRAEFVARRLMKILEEIKQNDEEIILFIDDFHIVGAAEEGDIDVAYILKQAIARGEVQCIGEATLDEYRKHIDKDPALERLLHLQPIKVPEPTVDETIQILKGVRQLYENHHRLRYTDEALVAAAQLSYECISCRFLPDKAIALIDGVGYRLQLRHAHVTAADIQRFLSTRPHYI